MNILGIDIGGSGIKGAPVDIETGALMEERYRLVTPKPSSPDAVGDVVAKVVKHFKWKGPVGCTVPSVVRDGVVYTAANIDEAWIGTNGRKPSAEIAAAPQQFAQCGCRPEQLVDGSAPDDNGLAGRTRCPVLAPGPMRLGDLCAMDGRLR